MPVGIHLNPADVDLDGFRSFIEAAGAVHDVPHEAGAEIIRFRVGNSFGLVSQRKDGRLTFAGVARPLLNQMYNNNPPLPPPVQVAIRIITLPADQHAEARALLSDTTRAEVHTDGSCEFGGLGGRGGWAAVIRAGFVNVEIFGGALSTTVNRMELIAAIAALELLPPTCAVRVLTDSQYVRKGIKKWIDGWKLNGWMTAAGTAVQNEDLWRRLDTLCAGRQVTWKWVRSHSGYRLNERADALARLGRISTNAAAGEATAKQTTGEHHAV